jgi:hypothetical protein
MQAYKGKKWTPDFECVPPTIGASTTEFKVGQVVFVRSGYGKIMQADTLVKPGRGNCYFVNGAWFDTHEIRSLTPDECGGLAKATADKALDEILEKADSGDTLQDIMKKMLKDVRVCMNNGVQGYAEGKWVERTCADGTVKYLWPDGEWKRRTGRQSENKAGYFTDEVSLEASLQLAALSASTTSDGVVVFPGDEVWHPAVMNGTLVVHKNLWAYCGTLGSVSYRVSACYSTKVAAGLKNHPAVVPTSVEASNKVDWSLFAGKKNAAQKKAYPKRNRRTGLTKALCALRKESGLTLRGVADLSNGKISNAYLSQLETGKIKNPSAKVLRYVAAVYAKKLRHGENIYPDLMKAAGYL